MASGAPTPPEVGGHGGERLPASKNVEPLARRFVAQRQEQAGDNRARLVYEQYYAFREAGSPPNGHQECRKALPTSTMRFPAAKGARMS